MVKRLKLDQMSMAGGMFTVSDDIKTIVEE